MKKIAVSFLFLLSCSSNNIDKNIKKLDYYFKYNLDYNHDELGGAEYLPYTEYMNYKDDSLSIKYIDENEEFIENLNEYEKLLKATDDYKSLLIIENQILSCYMNLVVDNE